MRVLALSSWLSLGCWLILVSLPASAFEVEERRTFDVDKPSTTLRIVSTGDADLFAPMILDFQRIRPDVVVEYVVVGSTDLMVAIEEERSVFDIAISSAMDLQVKLANDGLALPHRSPVTEALPEPAVWRNRVFAFTREPAAIAVSEAAFEGRPIPQTRQELIETLRGDPEFFTGRVGTYDIRQSGLGFLFATQDARSSDTFWRLMEVLGTLDLRLYCCSSPMIDDLVSGDLAVAYNVLGSYVRARGDDGVLVIEPTDFTTVMMRTALIPATSENVATAASFLDHLLERSWGLSNEPLNVPTNTGEDQPWHRLIRLGPGLLVYLDRLKKDVFLKEWDSATAQ